MRPARRRRRRGRAPSVEVQPVCLGVLRSGDVRVGATAVPLASPGQRALLAQLLVSANETVSASRLIDGLWGNAPPQHPDSALHVVVCRLRRSLGALAPRVIRDSSGYRIEVDCDELDLTRTHAFAADANRTLREGDPARAACLFDAALACWTGEPLADVANYSFYDATARDLRELRLGIIESRNASYLRCGRHLDVLADVQTWIETEPWRERLRAHQMVALYRSDRQIEALAAYDELRRVLLADFGVDPHEDLQRLHGRILRGDVTLLADRGDVQSREVAQPPTAVIPDRPPVRREITLDPADCVMVEGGPGVERSWLVAELPSRTRNESTSSLIDLDDAFQRVSLHDWLNGAR